MHKQVLYNATVNASRKLLFQLLPFLKTLCQILFIDWLQQIVYAVYFERLQSIFIVRCCKDHRAVNINVFEDFKAQSIRELDIHENEI